MGLIGRDRRPRLTVLTGGRAAGSQPAGPRPRLVALPPAQPRRPRGGNFTWPRLVTWLFDLAFLGLALGAWVDADWGGLLALLFTYLSVALLSNLHGIAAACGLRHSWFWLRLLAASSLLLCLASLLYWLGPWLPPP